MTLTTEQLNGYAKVFRKDAERWGEKGEPEIAQELHALADELDALAANRKAQPVMWAHERKLSTDVAITKDVTVVAAWESEGLNVTPLYAAPPAPAVVKLPTEFYSNEGIVVRLEQVMAALAVVGVKCERKSNAKTRCEFPSSEVPEEMTGGIAMSKYKVKKSNYAQWVKGWNACRAAMLAAAPEGGNG